MVEIFISCWLIMVVCLVRCIALLNQGSIIVLSLILVSRLMYVVVLLSLRVSFFFLILVFPIFKGVPKSVHLEALADNIIHKLTHWKGHTLSLPGRKCLINSFIMGSLVHSIMIYKWSGSLLSRLEVAIRNYLWT